MILNLRTFASGLALVCLCASAAGEAAALSREEMAAATVSDDFSMPTPGELFAALNKQGKVDWAGKYRVPIATSYTSRAKMALNLGGLIADGYIAVEAEDAQQVKNLGKDILALAKGLGVPKEILDRGKSLKDKADGKQWDVLKEELEATQNEVKLSMAANKDSDLIDLVTVGGWIRGTDVISGVIAENYTEASAKVLRQPGLASFLHGRLDRLPEKLRDDPAVKSSRMKLLEIQQVIALARDQAPPVEAVKALHSLTTELLKEISKKATK